MKKFTMLMAAALVGLSASAADWYLVGANFGWTDNETYKFTPNADNAAIQTLQVSELAGTMKVKEANTWSTSFGSNGSKLSEGVVYNANKDGGDITIDGSISDATITINTTDYTIVVTGKSAENDYTCVYLVGDFGSGWNESDTSYPLNLKEGTTNVYEGKYDLTAATSYFKMKAGNLVYGTGGNDIAVVLGTEYTAAQSGNAFSIKAGEYTFSYVLDKNADTGVLTVTGKSEGGDEPDPTPDYSTWYVNVFGPFNGWADNGVNPVDGISTTENLPINAEGFKIKIWNGTKDLFYSAATEIPVGEWVQFYEDGYDKVTTIAGANAETVYNVEYDVKNNMCKVTMVEAAVNTIEAANGEAVYFNLQGARVANPEAGLYIRVANGKAQKVLVK